MADLILGDEILFFIRIEGYAVNIVDKAVNASYISDVTGLEVVNPDYLSTDFIEVTPGDTIIYRGVVGNAVSPIAGYDQADSFIFNPIPTNFSENEFPTDQNIIIPSGVVKIKASFRNLAGDYRKLALIEQENDFFTVACLTSNDVSETTQSLETTVRGNNGWRSYIPGIQDYTVNIGGVIDRASDFSYNFLQGLKREKIIFQWRAASGDNVIVDEGSAFISSLIITAPSGDIANFSATLTPGVGGIQDVLVWSQDGDNIVTQNGTNLTQI